MTDRKVQRFVGREQQAVAQIISGLEILDALKKQYDAENYSATMTADDFEGSSLEGRDPETFKAVFYSLSELATWRAAGHEANFYRALPDEVIT